MIINPLAQGRLDLGGQNNLSIKTVFEAADGANALSEDPATTAD